MKVSNRKIIELNREYILNMFRNMQHWCSGRVLYHEGNHQFLGVSLFDDTQSMVPFVERCRSPSSNHHRLMMFDRKENGFQTAEMWYSQRRNVSGSSLTGEFGDFVSSRKWFLDKPQVSEITTTIGTIAKNSTEGSSVWCWMHIWLFQRCFCFSFPVCDDPTWLYSVFRWLNHQMW